MRKTIRNLPFGRILLLFLVVAALTSLTACQSGSPGSRAPDKADAINARRAPTLSSLGSRAPDKADRNTANLNGRKEIRFAVVGMTCEDCAKSATQALREIPGVRGAQVDFRTKQATVRTNGRPTRDDIEGVLKKVNFRATFPERPQAEPKQANRLPRQDVTSQAPVPKAVEFTLRGMTCEACATTAEKALAKISGVEKVAVDFDSKTVKLTTRGAVSADQVREALKPSGFEALFPSDAPPPKSISTGQKRSLDIQIISRGEKIRIADHLVAGKFTIFDFFAEWCGPCHLLTPKLERLVRDRGNIALRTVDLVDWKSAAAKQATQEFRLPALPYIRVYGPKGDFLGAVEGNRIEQIEKLIAGSTNR